MELRQMIYFAEIVTEQSFSKAASKLHLSQPALSKMIKQLEEELGIQLLDRSNKKFKLTDCGEIFLKSAKNIIEKHNTIYQEVNDIVGLKKGKISIAFPAIVATLYFPKIFTGFRNKNPGIEISMFEEGSNTIIEKVLGGLVDIGVVMLPINLEELDVYPIIHDESMLVINKMHTLANQDMVTFKDLQNEEFIILNQHFKLHDLIIDKCNEVGFEPNIIFRSSQYDFIMEMISLNQGISILPRPMLEKHNYPMVKYVALAPRFDWNIGIVVKKDSYQSFAMKEFIRFVTQIWIQPSLFEKSVIEPTKSL